MEDDLDREHETPAIDPSLLDAVRRMTPWERIVHNDRMIRTIKLLRPSRTGAEADDRGGR